MSDVMRIEYRKLTTKEKDDIYDLKANSLEIYKYLNYLGESRELSIAKTKLEEVVMWATKHITS